MTDLERPPMDINDLRDLHSALADLAGTTVDDPGLLSAVHRDAGRSHRRRAALVGGSGLLVVGGAVAVAAGGFPSAGHPLVPAGSPLATTTTTLKPAAVAPLPVTCAAASSAAGAQASGGVVRRAAAPAPVIATWTGDPPAVGQSFDVTGTVTASTAATVTVALNPGATSGTVALTSPGTLPLGLPPTGATVEISGTRTGQGTYDVASMGMTSADGGVAFKAGAAEGAAGGPAGAGPTISSWSGDPPGVGQSFQVTGTVTAATGSTMTIAVNGGNAGGTVTLTNAADPSPAHVASGAMVDLSGSRTGQAAYAVRTMRITSAGVAMGFSTGSASSAGGGAAGSPAGGAPTITAWTGDPPAVGQSFQVAGTVAAATATTVTVVLNSGNTGGRVTLANVGGTSAAAVPTGATVELSGSRTGQDAYDVTTMGVTISGGSECFSGPSIRSSVSATAPAG
jgi:hypothetical protein